MKNYLITYGCAMFLLASCGSPSQQPKAPGQIDIAGKIESLTELKASDFIKEIIECNGLINKLKKESIHE